MSGTGAATATKWLDCFAARRYEGPSNQAVPAGSLGQPGCTVPEGKGVGCGATCGVGGTAVGAVAGGGAVTGAGVSTGVGTIGSGVGSGATCRKTCSA